MSRKQIENFQNECIHQHQPPYTFPDLKNEEKYIFLYLVLNSNIDSCP
jgi:hypothetical protein